MAHFAELESKIDPTGFTSDTHLIVKRVVVVDNKHVPSDEHVDGETWCKNFFGENTLWKQTSFNTYRGVHKNGKTPLRGNYAGLGMSYDDENDLFIHKQPYPSWTLNVAEARWVSPAGDEPSVTDEEHEAGTHYQWNETTKAWDKVTS